MGDLLSKIELGYIWGKPKQHSITANHIKTSGNLLSHNTEKLLQNTWYMQKEARGHYMWGKPDIKTCN